MGIIYQESNQNFHLFTKDTSYIIQIVNNKYLMHCYWGKRLSHVPHYERLITLEDFNSFSPNPDNDDQSFSLGTMPREYPDFGKSDYRNPAYRICQVNGSCVTEAEYKSYRIYGGKKPLDGLPFVYTEEGDQTDTLEITLHDQVINMDIVLVYTVFEGYNAITRSVRFENNGNQKVVLDTAYSMNVDFYNDSDFEVINLFGAWARERHVCRNKLGVGSMVIDSKRGASSHMQNPFLALVREGTDDRVGEAYGINLIYSGNFKGLVEVTPYNITRLAIGINEVDFKWNLEPDEVFQTPEVVMVYSDKGLNKMSQSYHKLYRERLCRGMHRDAERPILINNWEATYFLFDEDKIKRIIHRAADLGIELFVLDDGWFGKRNDDKSGLGDWFVNEHKLPNGLKGLTDYANKKGMKFGLWFEPEMVSPDSDLYKEHPDWCLHVPDRKRTEGRNQLILDLSRQEVRGYITKVLSDVLESANIDYVKWDMNRNMTEVGSIGVGAEKQGEISHRYILGLYEILETITARFPHILFESCAGGGGRFDGGMLYYMPQTWTSDDTDAYERVMIQYGTSLCYPQITMASHISEVPNHQVFRMTDIEMRAHVAMLANMGFELDVTKFLANDQLIVKEIIKRYKDLRQIIQFGTFYRLISPFGNNHSAFMIVSEDEKTVIAYYYRFLKRPNAPMYRLKLYDLESDAVYRNTESLQEYYGEELMQIGIEIPHMYGDFKSKMMVFLRVD